MVNDSDFVDQETLTLARAGDPDAFSRLWRVYQPQLLRYLSSQATGATDDVASQVWIDVERSFASFEGDGEGFRRWLFTIGRRRAIDHARREQRRPEVAVDPLDRMATQPEDVDDRFDLTDDLERIEVLLSELRPDVAQVVMLRVVRDLPVAEVAEITGLTEANVRVMAHRGVATLRRMLEPVTPRIDASAPLEHAYVNRWPY